MRIVVDLNRCQGYAQCCFLAPRAFKLIGEEALMYDPEPDDSQREQILRAVAASMSGPGSDNFKANGRIVIVGASLAGLRAAETLREEGFTGQLTLIGD